MTDIDIAPSHGGTYTLELSEGEHTGMYELTEEELSELAHEITLAQDGSEIL